MFSFHDSIDTIPKNALVVGIEATRPDHRAACSVNIDPQHGGGGIRELADWLAGYGVDEGSWPALAVWLDEPPELVAAVTLASAVDWSAVRPGEEIAFLTSRPDLDSLSAMALADAPACARVLTDSLEEGFNDYAEQYESLFENAGARDAFLFWGRVRKVEGSDCFAAGQTPWKARPLPTTGDMWGDSTGSIDSRRDLAAIHSCCCDRSASIAERVDTVRVWLMTEATPGESRIRVEYNRERLVRESKIDVVGKGTREIALVESLHPGASSLGYCIAPVVVATNPSFGVDAGMKHTIFYWAAPSRESFQELVDLLNDMEARLGGDPTWGGNPKSGIIGSSQTQSSSLTAIGVVACIQTAHGDPITKPGYVVDYFRSPRLGHVLERSAAAAVGQDAYYPPSQWWSTKGGMTFGNSNGPGPEVRITDLSPLCQAIVRGAIIAQAR